MEESVLRRGVAEFIGTFTLIFIGGGAGAISGNDIVAVALANGLAIGIMVSNFGHISGGLFNPAITLGFLSTRRITPRRFRSRISIPIAGFRYRWTSASSSVS